MTCPFLGKFNENAGNLNFKQCSNYCFARSVYLRGRDAKGTNVSLLNEDSQYSNYLSPSLRFNNYWSPRGIKKFENFATTLSNDQSYLQQVDTVVDKRDCSPITLLFQYFAVSHPCSRLRIIRYHTV